MSQYSVEFFDRELNNLHHDLLESPSIDNDLLSPNISTFDVTKTDKIPEQGFVFLSGDLDFFGVIDSVSDEDNTTQVSIRPLECIFDHKVVFDTAVQRTATTLEETIKNLITSSWINSGDDKQNLPLEVNTWSETDQWDLEIDASGEDNTKTIVNLLTDIIEPALERYGVAVSGYFDFSNKKIKIDISTYEDEFYIDADAASVTINEFMADKLDSDVNKLIIINSENYESEIVYYLHPDGTYDTTDDDRITPVLFDIVTVSVQSDSTFEEAAAEQAENTFNKLKFKNYAELEVIPKNTAISPYALNIGQRCKIYHKDESIDTILTGMTIEDYVTLIFGTIRLDITKQ